MTEVAALVITGIVAAALAFYLKENYGWELPKRRRSNSVISKKHKKYFNLKP